MENRRPHFYRVLSDKEINDIHEAGMVILERVGFKISYEPMLKILEENGAKVDRRENRAYLSRELVSRCVESAPAEFTFYGLEKGKEIRLGGGKVHFGTGGKALYVLDANQERKPAALEDIAGFARLADQLDPVSFYIIPVHAHDVNVKHLDVCSFYQALKYTGKPVMGGVFSSEGLQRVIELASALSGGLDKLSDAPFVGFITSITSPLQIDNDRAEILMQVARHRLPLVVSTAPVAGATAPVTLAGTLTMQNVEALIGIVLSQLVNPGAPVFYSAVPYTMDMRSGTFLAGSIESGLMNAAITQMAQHYRLPSYLSVGVTDAKLPDAQASYESAANCMLAALAGGDYIHQAFGLLDGALTISYAQFVIDSDIAGSCLRAQRGIEINPDTIAVDLIAEVGPGGNFLTQKHTVEYMRSESFTPRASIRQSYEAWFEEGKKDASGKAGEIVQQLFAGPVKTYISEQEEARIFSLFPELQPRRIA